MSDSSRRDGAPIGRIVRRISFLGVASAAIACGGDDGTTSPGGGGGGGGGGTPGFTITAPSTALTVARGASGTVTVTVTRTGTFTGPVSLQATGQPAGVTAVFSAASVVAGQTTSTLTITATATATAGTTPITITANGAGVSNQFLTLQLTVTVPAQAGPFSMSLSVSSFLALPATVLASQPVLTITRNAGFTGPVALSVSGLPVGLVVGATPTSVTGNTATLVILNAATANGTYPITIRGVAAGLGEQSITFQVVVAPASTGSVQWQFCDNGARTPIWFFAVREVNGSWTRVVPNGSTYAFNAAGASPAVAIVTPEDVGTRTTIYQFSAQEMAARAASECVLYPNVSTRTANGTATGGTAADLSYVSMGWWSGSLNGNGSYTLQNLPPGPLDLVAVRGAVDATATTALTRGIVRRAVNPASGAANAPLDFTAAESFAMAPVTWTFGNTNNQAFGITQMFNTSGGTYGSLSLRPGIDNVATTRTLYGIPAAQTVQGDLHEVVATVASVTTGGAPRATRQIITFARTLAARTINFGPALPAPTVSAVALAGAAPRLRAQGTLPTEYSAGVSLDFSQPSLGRFGTFHTTQAALGGSSTYDLQMPDLTAATGWDSNFSMRAGTATNWWVSGGGPALDMFDVRYIFASTHGRWTGALTGIAAPAEGATYLFGRAAGSITP
jgi:hypothetical protein